MESHQCKYFYYDSYKRNGEEIEIKICSECGKNYELKNPGEAFLEK